MSLGECLMSYYRENEILLHPINAKKGSEEGGEVSGRKG